MEIEFLFWDGCPSHPEAKQLLDDVLAERGLDAEVKVREVYTQAEAEELRFPGSPTIRVDGEDVDPAGASARPALNCRIYRKPDGRPSPVPNPRTTGGRTVMTIALATEAPTFDLPGVDGRQHSLGDYADTPALAVVWSCNHCPYVQAWEGRMIELQREFGDRGFGLVAISSNDADAYPEDSFEAMQARAEEQGFNFDYLYDEDQSVLNAYGAERTPEVFLFDSDRGSSTTARSTTRARRTRSRSATCGTRSKQCSPGETPAVDETPAVGCTVKRKP